MSADGRSPRVWQERRRTVHAETPVFTVERRTLQRSVAEPEHDVFVVCPAEWAVALARTVEGEWVMVRQFRFGTARLMWEFPSGCCEAGEDPVVAAARELREESGFAGSRPVVLGVVEPNPAIQDNRCTYVFFRKVERVGPPTWDEHEEMEIATLSDAEVRAAACDGRMPHALMHAGLFLYDAWQTREGAQPT